MDGEGSVLCLDGEGGVSSLSAFAAVGLADLVELSVGNSLELLRLGCLSVLLVALSNTGTEAWEVVEFAGAGHVELWESEGTHGKLACAGGVSRH